MELLLQRIQQAQRKTTKLGKTLQDLREQNARLEKMLKEAKKDLEERNMECERLQQKYDALKLVKSMNNPGDREAVQSKIDLYLKEIDICLKNFGD